MERVHARDLPPEGFVNVGTGEERTIAEVADMVRRTVYADAPGRDCRIVWDASKPNGTPRKLCDVSRLAALGWRPRMELGAGLALAYRDFLRGQCRR